MKAPRAKRVDGTPATKQPLIRRKRVARHRNAIAKASRRANRP